MKKRNFVFRISTVIISFVLIAVMAFIMTSCGKEAAVSERKRKDSSLRSE